VVTGVGHGCSSSGLAPLVRAVLFGRESSPALAGAPCASHEGERVPQTEPFRDGTGRIPNWESVRQGRR
jgi:hypothetical protein